MVTESKKLSKAASPPVVLLDIDDVLCLSNPYGGRDVIQVFSGARTDADLVFRKLFKPYALEVLRRVHEEIGSDVSYVISSSWRLSFDRDQMVQIFNEAGASFVADSLRAGDAWCTPDIPEQTRAHEIELWLQTHGRGEPFVILDDRYSGKSFLPVLADSTHVWHKRVILCDEWVGLLHEYEAAILAALMTPCASTTSPNAENGT